MKAILFLLVVGFAGCIYWEWERAEARRQISSEGRIALGMTHEDVERAFGKPVHSKTDRFGADEVQYSNFVLVGFANGKTIWWSVPHCPF